MSKSCDELSHALARTSIQALSILARNQRVRVWPGRPELGMVRVSGDCRSCLSSLSLDVDDAEWESFSGQPVPSWVQAYEEVA